MAIRHLTYVSLLCTLPPFTALHSYNPNFSSPATSTKARGKVTVLGGLNNGLGAHAAGLGGKVDAFARALGHIAGGVADKRDTALGASGPRVLRDGVCLHTDYLPALCLNLHNNQPNTLRFC